MSTSYDADYEGKPLPQGIQIHEMSSRITIELPTLSNVTEPMEAGDAIRFALRLLQVCLYNVEDPEAEKQNILNAVKKLY